jgi:uncharacterized protein YjeT (DUF2065 family)
MRFITNPSQLDLLQSEKESMTMKVIVYFLGFVYIAIGSICILYTRESIDALKKLIQEIPLKVLSSFPAVIGILAFVKAVVIFINPHNLYNRLLDWYFNVSDQTQRLFGIISIIFGTAIVTWIN